MVTSDSPTLGLVCGSPMTARCNRTLPWELRITSRRKSYVLWKMAKADTGPNVIGRSHISFQGYGGKSMRRGGKDGRTDLRSQQEKRRQNMRARNIPRSAECGGNDAKRVTTRSADIRIGMVVTPDTSHVALEVCPPTLVSASLDRTASRTG